MKVESIDDRLKVLVKAAKDDPGFLDTARRYYDRAIEEGRGDYKSTDVVLDLTIIESLKSN